MNNQLAAHEALELHELLTFKTCCMTKSTTMQGLVTDARLKDLLAQDVQQSRSSIQELQGFISNMQ